MQLDSGPYFIFGESKDLGIISSTTLYRSVKNFTFSHGMYLSCLFLSFTGTNCGNSVLPPYIFLCGTLICFLLMLNQDTRAEGRGRVARIQRRLLVVEVEKWIMQYQTCVDQGKVRRQILCVNLENDLNSSLHNIFRSYVGLMLRSIRYNIIRLCLTFRFIPKN